MHLVIPQASRIFFIFGGLGLAAKIKGVAWQLSDTWTEKAHAHDSPAADDPMVNVRFCC